jgi:protein SCO1/2
VFYLHIIFLSAVAVGLSGCQSPEKTSLRPCCQAAMAAAPAAGGESATSPSALASPAVWQDDAGNNLQLAELRGHPVVISMFYASCEGLCVVTRNDMQAVEASLPAAVRDRTTFVLVTLAPDRDSAAVLKQYRVEQGLAGKRWRLLRGSPTATAALAAQLSIGYGRDAAGIFRHSSEITVLDEAGKIVQQQDGLHADLVATVKVLVAADTAN